MKYKYFTLCVFMFLLVAVNASKDTNPDKTTDKNDKNDENFESSEKNKLFYLNKKGVDIYKKGENFESSTKNKLFYLNKMDIGENLQSSNKLNMMDLVEEYEYAIYNMIDVTNHNGNSLYECFFIASSMLNQIDPTIQKFNDKFDIRKRILNYEQNLASYDYFAEAGWDGHFVAFSDLLRVNIIVYQKEKNGNGDYVKKSRFCDLGFNHTIRLAYINPENNYDCTEEKSIGEILGSGTLTKDHVPADSVNMHYGLLQKENIHVVKEEYPWYPEENDLIENKETKEKYRVITATEEDFITTINVKDREDNVIDVSEHDDAIYNYILTDIAIDKDISHAEEEVEEFIFGQRVQCRNHKGLWDVWMDGKVTNLNPLKVQPENFMISCEWDEVRIRKIPKVNFNIGDHIEVLKSFQTNAFHVNRMNLFRGQEVVIKNIRNDIIFVLNANGESWTHLQPIDATNFKNLKHNEPQKTEVVVKENKNLLQ